MTKSQPCQLLCYVRCEQNKFSSKQLNSYIHMYIYSTSRITVHLTDWWISWRATDCRCTCNNWAYHLLNARRLLPTARAIQFIWGFRSLYHQQSQIIGKIAELSEKYLAPRRRKCRREDPITLMTQRLKQGKIIAVPDEGGYMCLELH